MEEEGRVNDNVKGNQEVQEENKNKDEVEVSIIKEEEEVGEDED